MTVASTLHYAPSNSSPSSLLLHTGQNYTIISIPSLKQFIQALSASFFPQPDRNSFNPQRHSAIMGGFVRHAEVHLIQYLIKQRMEPEVIGISKFFCTHCMEWIKEGK